MRLTKGYVHIYTGDGKGKTSAALGLGLRAAGAGLKVCMIQFLKGGAGRSSERDIDIKGFRIICCGQVHPIFFKKQDIPRLKKAISKDLKGARDKMVSKKFDVIILDEIINALAGGFLDAPELARFIRARPANVELVLTGRGDTRPIESLADYVTYFKKLKHPFDSRARARRGIEF